MPTRTRAKTALRPPAPPPRPARGLWLLLILAPLALYLSTAPLRNEYGLRHASLTELQAKAQLDPDDMRVQVWLARRAREQGQYPLALEAYKHAGAADTADAALWSEWARAADAAGQGPVAVGILRTFCKLNPQSGEAHAALARLLLQKNTLPEADGEAGQAVALAPQSADAWLVSGDTAYAMQRNEEAQHSYRRAVAVAPNDWRGYQGLGDIAFRQKRYPEAAAQYRKASALNPRNGRPALMLGRALLESSTSSDAELRDAKQNLQAAATLPGLTPQDRLEDDLALGRVCEALNQWPEALTRLKQAVSENPNNAIAHYELARVYRQLNDSADAAQEMKTHERIYAYILEGVSLMNRVTASPQDRQARLQFARLYASHGDTVNAAKQYRILLQQDPGSATFRREFAALGPADGTPP